MDKLFRLHKTEAIGIATNIELELSKTLTDK